jgi:hypothetical protein
VIDTTRYLARVFWSDEDEGFIAEAVDLPGCSVFCQTQSEAIMELQHYPGVDRGGAGCWECHTRADARSRLKRD